MKDAYYFPHDSNAKDDPKCIMLIEELGLEGYGIFWMLLETLRDQPGYKAPINMIPGLARRYNSTPEKVKAVVLRYQLFEVDEDEFFFSLSFQRRMEVIDGMRQKRSIAGRKGNEVRWGSQSDRNAIAKHRKGKESKGKESKKTYSEFVERLYQAYPRKVAPKKAKEKIEIALRDNDYDYLKQKVELYAKSINGTEKQFIPHPATWFHQERFNDDPKEWISDNEAQENTPPPGFPKK